MKTNRFLGIQALRGIAACMVVACHASGAYHEHHGGWTWDNGASGVDVFFVISGFVMAVSSVDKAGLTAGKFLRQRIIRIVPLYWIMTGLMLIKMHLPGSGSRHVETPASYIVSSLLFIPYRNSIGDIFPVVVQGWTLCYEMLFYALFSVALLLGIKVIRFIGPALAIVALAGMFYKDTWPAPASLISPIVVEFLFGLLIGSALRKFNTYVNTALAIAGVAGLSFIPMFHQARPLSWGIPALLLVQSATRWDKVPEIMLKIGDASYSLYLSHLFVVLVVTRALGKLPESITVTACIAASIGASFVIYQLVEKPITDKLRMMSKPRIPVPQLAGTVASS